MLWEECGSAGALTKTPLIKITRENLGFTCNCIFSNSQSCFRIVSYVVVLFHNLCFVFTPQGRYLRWCCALSLCSRSGGESHT